MRRRTFLGASAAVSTALLAGCSRDDGDGSGSNGSSDGGGAVGGYSMGPRESSDG